MRYGRGSPSCSRAVCRVAGTVSMPITYTVSRPSPTRSRRWDLYPVNRCAENSSTVCAPQRSATCR